VERRARGLARGIAGTRDTDGCSAMTGR
jgi:hypothetical protein